MPPRYLERIDRKADTMNTVFGSDNDSRPRSCLSSQSSFTPSNELSRTSSQSHKTPPTPPPSYSHLKPQSSSTEDRVLPKDSLVLVTGANSFQGSHIVDQLLQHGYRVRGTVRDHKKAAATCTYFQDKYGTDRFTSLIVPDMAIKGALDDAIEGCAGAIHVASVTTMSPDPNEVITPSIAGALNALEAAASQSSLVRFVYTSSIAAAVSGNRSARKEVTSDSWNLEDLAEAWAPPPYEEERAFAVCNSSKMQTEAVVRKWYEDRKPGFVLNIVLPDTLWGQMLDLKSQEYPLSVMVLKAVFDGEPLDYPPCNFVDVQDSALLHLAALILPDIRGQRIFAVAGPWNMQCLVQLMRRLYTDRELDGNVRNLGIDQTIFKEADQAERLLKRMGRKGWTNMGTCVQKNCQMFF